MKTSSRSILSAVAVLLLPAIASAHPGHGLDAEVHSFLHGEHILSLLVIALLYYVIRKHYRD